MADSKEKTTKQDDPIKSPVNDNIKQDKKDIKKFIDKQDKKSKKLDKSRDLYYFYSVGCGFCKKSEPIVDELNKEGYNILKLDLAEKDNQGLKQELEKKYKAACGTPWFVDPESGNQICGFREKNLIKKWADGEEIPAPVRPKSPIPKIPFHGASKKEEDAWKKEYAKWVEENSELPNIIPADQILSRPRPASDPPKPPPPSANDEQLTEWKKEYEKWVKDNGHLPNLQPADTLINRFKQQRDQMPGQVPPASAGLSADQEARFRRLEQKVDKLIKHLGVK